MYLLPTLINMYLNEFALFVRGDKSVQYSYWKSKNVYIWFIDASVVVRVNGYGSCNE